MKKPRTKIDLAYLLGQYGSGFIDSKQFWGAMQANGYTQGDINKWCDEFYQLEKERGDGQRKEKQGRTT
jgi:hypothetical protein